MSQDEITNVAEVLARLRESEELYARAFMSNPIAMSLTSLGSGRFTHINTAFANLAGWNRSEVIGRTSDELRFWPERGNRESVGRRIEAGDDFPLVRTEMRRKDGVLVPVLASFRLLKVGIGDSVLSVLVPIGK